MFIYFATSTLSYGFIAHFVTCGTLALRNESFGIEAHVGFTLSYGSKKLGAYNTLNGSYSWSQDRTQA
jgi:hypothetical protein